jgi:2-haloacid dehalogenase
MAWKAIIYDLGGVLVDWNPLHVYDEQYFDSAEKRKFFFDQVCTSDWNERQDEGYSIALATEEKVKEFPEWESPIRDFYGRWTEMLKGPIADSVDLFRRLREKTDLRFYALTNWSHETFPVALERFEFLQWFDGIVVSGTEKNRKPFPSFYQLLLERYSLQASEVIFIDDNLRNIHAARELGIESIPFTDAESLEKKITALLNVSLNR